MIMTVHCKSEQPAVGGCGGQPSPNQGLQLENLSNNPPTTDGLCPGGGGGGAPPGGGPAHETGLALTVPPIGRALTAPPGIPSHPGGGPLGGGGGPGCILGCEYAFIGGLAGGGGLAYIPGLFS